MLCALALYLGIKITDHQYVPLKMKVKVGAVRQSILTSPWPAWPFTFTVYSLQDTRPAVRIQLLPDVAVQWRVGQHI